MPYVLMIRELRDSWGDRGPITVIHPTEEAAQANSSTTSGRIGRGKLATTFPRNMRMKISSKSTLIKCLKNMSSPRPATLRPLEILIQALPAESAEAAVSRFGVKARAAKSGVRASRVPEASGQPACPAFDLLRISASKIGGY